MVLVRQAHAVVREVGEVHRVDHVRSDQRAVSAFIAIDVEAEVISLKRGLPFEQHARVISRGYKVHKLNRGRAAARRRGGSSAGNRRCPPGY